MNFHSDKYIMEKINEHYEEAKTLFPEDQIVGIFCQGSPNYGLDTENSDIDTKLIVVPSVDNIIFNKKPVSTTHVRANDEHIDLKDIRLYIQTFRKQNLNFVEILFTKYKILNPKYERDWKTILEKNNEAIAHYNPYRAVKTMRGIALEKYHALEHPYPSKAAILAQFGYDPKQLHHLLRVYEFLSRYISGDTYAKCLKPVASGYLKDVKLGYYNLEDARKVADATLELILSISDNYFATHKDEVNPDVDEILNLAQKEIMKKAIYG